MARQRSLEGVAELRAQANAARRAAELSHDASTRALACAAAQTLESVASSQLRKLEAEREPVLVLPDNASAAEIRRARQNRSVKCGETLFLPSWQAGVAAIPNVLLRSALFKASTRADAIVLVNDRQAVQGDASLILSGYPLMGYDRRVLSACLNHYRESLPVSLGDEPTWIETSFWQFAQQLCVAYGQNVHKAIAESLMRLNAACLRVRIRGVDYPLCRLLEVVGTDSNAPNRIGGDARLRGSDRVRFRVPAEMANFFGPAAWTAVSDSALHDYCGLTAWLACYFSSHAGPYPLKLLDLYDWSGVVCEPREFRRRLKQALAQLQRDDVPENLRVSAYAFTDTHLTVKLCRWKDNGRVIGAGAMPSCSERAGVAR